MHAVLGRSKQYAWRQFIQIAAATAGCTSRNTGCQWLHTRGCLHYKAASCAAAVSKMVLSESALCWPGVSCPLLPPCRPRHTQCQPARQAPPTILLDRQPADVPVLADCWCRTPVRVLHFAGCVRLPLLGCLQFPLEVLQVSSHLFHLLSQLDHLVGVTLWHAALVITQDGHLQPGRGQLPSEQAAMQTAQHGHPHTVED